MKTTAPLFLAVLALLFPSVVGAGDGLAELAATKRGAALSLDIPGRIVGFGAFVSEDGLALVSLGSLALKERPTVTTSGGTRLGFGEILGIFPEQEMALMKFKYRPRMWLRIATKEPEIGQHLAIAPLSKDNHLDRKAPPLVGMVLAKRSGTTTNLRVSRFTRIFTLGSNASPGQLASIRASMYAIDHRGDLVGFMGGFETVSKQTMSAVVSAVGLGGKVGELADAGKAIPFPLPGASNLIDLALLDDDFGKFDMALRRRDRVSAKKILIGLLERYPESESLKSHAAANSTRDERLIKLADLPELDPGSAAAQQVDRRISRSVVLAALEGDNEGAIRELKAAAAISPKDYPFPRVHLGGLYLHLGRPDDAERIWREVYQSMPENIEFVENFAFLLFRQGKLEEGKKLSKWVNDLRDIYGWR